MVILNQNVTIYVMLNLCLYLSKELHKQSSEFSRIMVFGAKFNSLTVAAILRSGLLKMATERKILISL